MAPTAAGWVRGRHLWIRSGREERGVVFVVQGKLGKAVQRNLLKRRLREICRPLRPSLPGSLVVLARPSAIQAPFSELREDFGEVLSRL